MFSSFCPNVLKLNIILKSSSSPKKKKTEGIHALTLAVSNGHFIVFFICLTYGFMSQLTCCFGQGSSAVFTDDQPEDEEKIFFFFCRDPNSSLVLGSQSFTIHTILMPPLSKLFKRLHFCFSGLSCIRLWSVCLNLCDHPKGPNLIRLSNYSSNDYTAKFYPSLPKLRFCDWRLSWWTATIRPFCIFFIYQNMY